MTDAPSNLLRNAAFESVGANGVAEHWDVTGPLRVAVVRGDDPAVGRRVQHLAGAGNGMLHFRQRVRIPSRSDLLFRVRVRSNGRLVIRVGERKLGYQDTGQWQTIADVIRTHNETEIDVALTLGAEAAEPCDLAVADIELHPIDAPVLPPARPASGFEIGAEEGRLTFIVYPAGCALYREQAKRVQDAVQAWSGMCVPVIDDREVTMDDQAILKVEWLLSAGGKTKVIKRQKNEYRVSVDKKSYESGVEAQSKAIALFADQVAKTIQEFHKQSDNNQLRDKIK